MYDSIKNLNRPLYEEFFSWAVCYLVVHLDLIRSHPYFKSKTAGLEAGTPLITAETE